MTSAAVGWTVPCLPVSASSLKPQRWGRWDVGAALGGCLQPVGHAPQQTDVLASAFGRTSPTAPRGPRQDGIPAALSSSPPVFLPHACFLGSAPNTPCPSFLSDPPSQPRPCSHQLLAGSADVGHAGDRKSLREQLGWDCRRVVRWPRPCVRMQVLPCAHASLSSVCKDIPGPAAR